MTFRRASGTNARLGRPCFVSDPLLVKRRPPRQAELGMTVTRTSTETCHAAKFETSGVDTATQTSSLALFCRTHDLTTVLLNSESS